MATSEFWQRVAASVSPSPEWEQERVADFVPSSKRTAKLWMVLDGITILGAAVVATLYVLHTGLVEGARGFWFGTLIHHHSMVILLALVCGFAVALMFTSQRLNLYTPTRLSSILNEQRLSVQACFTSGLLLTGTLYLVKAEDIPHSIVLTTLGLVTILLSLRRLIYRIMLYRHFEHGIGTRNVLILGTGPEAHALRHQFESIRRLGYTFKGFIDPHGPGTRIAATSGDVVCTLDTLFQHARKLFVDEIFITTPCERSVVQDVLGKAHSLGMDLRVVPDIVDGLARNSPIEYIGQFPTIPLHRGQVAGTSLVLKRALDVVFSSLVIVALAPLALAIAIAIKLDSPGPVFYFSDRLGKRCRIFRLAKFRTMVRDAESKRANVMQMNERDEVLFKISNDPRITRLGRFLRKYSLDELPQFFNVLRGDMSVVGPRPPLAGEVREYKPNHLRRLDVTPGITGLWQVQARQNPSFDSYVSLDVTYIENWSIWLDLKIILRTIGVVIYGTRS